jgi:hypothetical protein
MLEFPLALHGANTGSRALIQTKSSQQISLILQKFE